MDETLIKEEESRIDYEDVDNKPKDIGDSMTSDGESRKDYEDVDINRKDVGDGDGDGMTSDEDASYPEDNEHKKKNTLDKCWIVVQTNLTFYFSNTWGIGMILFYIIFFSMLTLFVKFENETFAKVGTSAPLAFSHPITQTFFVFIGMACNVFINFGCMGMNFTARKVCNICHHKKSDPNMKDPNIWIFMIPAIFNTLRMMRSGGVLTTFVLSIILLKRNFWKFPHRWIGVFLVLAGVSVIGVDMIIFPEGEGQASVSHPFLGVIVTLISVLLNSMQFVSEEWLLTSYDTGPLQVTGYEGMWGVFFLLIVLFFAYLIPGNDYGRAENFPAALTQILDNYYLFIFVACTIPLFGLFIIMGNCITMYFSGATRAIVNQVPPLIVWIIQILRGRQEFEWLQLVGYIVVVFGIFVYFEVGFSIVLPMYDKWVKNVNEKDSKKKKDKRERKSIQHDDD